MKLANDNLGAEFQDFLTAACVSMLRVSQGPLYICMSSSELHHLHTASRSCNRLLGYEPGRLNLV